MISLTPILPANLTPEPNCTIRLGNTEYHVVCCQAVVLLQDGNPLVVRIGPDRSRTDEVRLLESI